MKTVELGRGVLDRWKFTALLVTLLCLLVVHPLISWRDDVAAPAYTVFLATAFLTVIMVLFRRRESRIAAFLLGVPTLVGVVANFALPGAPAVLGAAFLHLFPIAFLGYTVLVILRTIFRDPGVSSDGINGAFCGYLLLALAFGHGYCLLEAALPGAFILQEQIGPMPPEGGRRHALLTYYSLITLTTVGYGDIIPRTVQARTLASVEAVMGQFYVAVVVAELIALKVSAPKR
jgi:hypothetical protein